MLPLGTAYTFERKVGHSMVEISKLESIYIRPRFPDTSIYRTVNSHYLMSEESAAMKALESFRKLSIKDQKFLVKGRA